MARAHMHRALRFAMARQSATQSVRIRPIWALDPTLSSIANTHAAQAERVGGNRGSIRSSQQIAVIRA